MLKNLRGSCLAGCTYLDPFTGEPIELTAAIEISSFWRRLIDSNRPIKAAVGFANWKKSTVAPLLWAGLGPVPFSSRPVRIQEGAEVAAWKSRVSQRQLDDLAEQGVKLVEVEDGFIRSIGLGADCVPPLSIVVDRVGIYFDPQQPSELEELLEKGILTEGMLDRARSLRQIVVTSGISKYQTGMSVRAAQQRDRSHLLVIGQVEDDRSVRCGGGPVQSNLELLRRVRKEAPDAIIRYRPHPDVQAGHRVGAIAEEQLAGLADEVVASGTISEAIYAADEVHVNTSLAGFEALLRGKPVTTYGVPFYAGWGLTRDLGDVPSRRTAKRSLDELVAATLLLYPRYLDPVTGLPCPAEILALRLAENRGEQAKGVLVRLRQMQGRWKRRLSEFLLRVLK
ncbi:beta-3-deoxy-D-manno-oct-2-ulosonic acid transferase [Sphingomonas sp. NSE70-1]|uniref:Beta-3-deoxy-D-manno-oct-2-ulosonic acid transferase n=1 Tax=Sphingomonas caseinilyticus TaxID=2908205 RepID=A0ABT0RQP5_9SPHN|nr:beta-3-deoxy-D-manno-oct-2-ulosonic acid transferase [Sphingomonas caseinilyticus]MCL6697318.1 beta-3-deoxy-D-manno-oct-2-ulosonic acid transferase [Sphingomonas caseinilyticus]